MSLVLIADDNSENRYILELLLKKNGFDVISATNGKEALDALQARIPDLIVTDILMPVMDGFALCRQVKSDDRLKQIPFVFYTATYTEPKDIELGLRLGAARFLLKPMETEALLHELRQLLEEGRGEQREAEALSGDDTALLKQYNEALFRKLEKKMSDLQIANRRLEREIKERQSIETELRRSEENLKVLLDALPVGLSWADREGRIQYANTKFVELFGYGLDEIRTIDDWFVKTCPDARDRARYMSVRNHTWEGIRVEGGSIAAFDVRIQCKDGTFKDLSVTEARIMDRQLAVFVDITRRKELEQQLLQSQKLENIGNLAGGIAHDFNNVLTTVTGFAGILQMKMQGSDPLRPYVDQLAAAGMRGAALTHQLLAFSRKQILDIRPIDLNETMTNLQKMLQRLIREDVELHFSPFPQKLPVMADVNQVEQVIINLVTNARDAMPRGGSLDIATGTADIDDAFIGQNGYGEIGRYATITITDNGTGMDEATRQRIFEPFFTTKEVNKGTGLGLSVVYGIIRQHKGVIQVRSRLGEGSTFTVYLPLLEEKRDIDTLGRQREEESHFVGGTETILFAEDNEMLRTMTGNILRENGYTVFIAEDGASAVDLFRQHRKAIDLVVLDLIMPGKRGLQAYLEMAEEDPEVKALFVTGYSEDDVEREELSKRHLTVLMKPYNPVSFLRKVREMLDKR
jgi:PAS domain S-box-containing protein